MSEINSEIKVGDLVRLTKGIFADGDIFKKAIAVTDDDVYVMVFDKKYPLSLMIAEKVDFDKLTLTTGQMIDFMTKNPEWKAMYLDTGNVLILQGNLFVWKYGNEKYCPNISNCKWKLIPPKVKVGFADAFKAYLSGKVVASFTGIKYHLGKTEGKGMKHATVKEIDGEWTIED